ncbi:efflux RND transporter periplasmic adaptor subunit [Variovorax sp. PCZ-1]|uniref:efflux RND transporter periplasmic adaptor subunit n=1 Tax=Variovorax sp. PCZ-1 TaxID=2835533 RepID=UPI0032DEB08C
MASKAIYSAVAIVGIAAAAGAAYWYQNKPTGPKEITAAGSASAPAGGASAPGGAPRGGGMPSVEVAKVEASRLQDDAQAVGSLRSKQNVMLRPEVSGRVQTLGFTDGGRVRKGDVIMQLEDGLQRAEIRQAEAQMSIARANLKRNQELVAQNFVAQRVLDESAASLQVAEAQVSLACARWDRMRVIAPFDGTVGIRNVNIGDYVKDGADLVNLEDISSMFVDFRLPERFIGKIRREQAIELQLDALPGRQFKAKIEAIDPQLDANGRSVLVRAVLPNTGGEPLAQRPAGGPGGASGGAPGAGGAPAAAAKPAEKPAAKPAVRPPQRPASAPAAAAPRPVDPIATTCAQFSNAAVAARAAAGGTPSAAPGGRGTGGGAVAGGRPAGASGAPAGASSASNAGGAQAGARAAGAVAGGRPGAAGPGAGGGAPLRPGMFARVTAVFNVKDAALTIPEEAIVPQGGRQFVIRLVEQTEAQGKEIAEKQAADAAKAAEAAKAAAAASSAPVSAGAPAGGSGAGAAQPYNMSGFVDGKRLVSQRQEVKLGIRRPGRVEITEGLAEGETVVVAGQQRLQRDNTPVRVVELGRPPAGAPAGVPGGAPNAASGGVGGAAPAASATAAAMPAPAASR